MSEQTVESRVDDVAEGPDVPGPTEEALVDMTVDPPPWSRAAQPSGQSLADPAPAAPAPEATDGPDVQSPIPTIPAAEPVRIVAREISAEIPAPDAADSPGFEHTVPHQAMPFLPPAPPDAPPAVPPVSAPAKGENADAAPVLITPMPQATDPGSRPGDPEGVVDLTQDSGQLGDVGSPETVPSPQPAYEWGAPEPVPGTIQVEAPPGLVMPVVMPQELAGERRAARARALGEVDPGADVVTAPRLLMPPSVYRPWPSVTLILFRVIVAVIVAIRLWQQVTDFGGTKALWANSVLPQPEIMTLVQIGSECAIVVLLLVGFGARVAGALLMVLSIGVLSFLTWGAVNPFTDGVAGFAGEFELLMAAIGLVFLGVGGGNFAVDAIIHRARLERKNARLAEAGANA